MQKVGRKSKFIEIEIPNLDSLKKPYFVRVQANKNHGICDVVQGVYYENAKEVVFRPTRRIDSIISKFQGRQYDDPYVIEALENRLISILNGHE